MSNGTKYWEPVDIQHSVSGKWRSFKWLNKGWIVYGVDSGWNSPVLPDGVKGKKLVLPKTCKKASA